MEFRKLVVAASLIVLTACGAVSVSEAQPSDQVVKLSDAEYDAKVTEVENYIRNGVDLSRAGRMKDAVAPFEKALALCENYLGEGPYMVLTLENLGVTYATLGEFDKAEAADKRALSIAERIYKDSDDRKINAIANLGILYSRLGRYKEAEPLLVRALTLGEKARGKDDDRNGLVLYNLGQLYLKTGRKVEAKPLLNRAETILSKQPH